MLKSLVLISALMLSGVVPELVAPLPSEASLAYTRVRVEAVDTAIPTLTFKTAEGDVWTLPAVSADILRNLRKGDTCSVEIDLQDRVTKIVKVDPASP
jgi:hypothetical protein